MRVNQLNPGWVLTESENNIQKALGQPPDWPTRVPAQFAPFGRLITPEEIAAAAIYFLGDESRAISGCVTDLAQYPMIGPQSAQDTLIQMPQQQLHHPRRLKTLALQ